MGRIYPKNDGVAIFKALSIIGPTTINVKVTDNRIDKVCDGKIDVLITYPIKSGKLHRIRIKPPYVFIPMNEEKMFNVVAEDKEGNEISKNVSYYWKIIEDETGKASLETNEGENVILKVGDNVGSIKLQVIAEQDGKRVEDYALINVTEITKKSKGKPKTKDAGLPILHFDSELPSPNMLHSKLSSNGIHLHCYENHPDYKKAKAKSSKYHTRYIANLYAKELAKQEQAITGQDYGELFLDILSKMDRFM